MNGIDKANGSRQNGVTVFVSLPSSFPSQWAGLIHGRATDLKLCAFVYHGIPMSPFQQINNAEYEARTDMYSAKFVFAAIAVNDATDFDGIWIVKYIPKLKAYGIKFDLAIIGGDQTSLNQVHEVMNVPADTKFSCFSTPEKWLDFLNAEIPTCVCHSTPKPT